MRASRNRWGFAVVGAVAVLTLGVIAVASAAGTQTATPSPSASAQSGQAHTPDLDGDGPHGDAAGGRIHRGGPGDIPEALASLSGKDVSEIMAERAAGKSFAEIAEAAGVGTDELLAEATRIETAELDAAVEAGAMTAAERTQMLSGLAARLEDALSETGALPAHGGPDTWRPRTRRRRHRRAGFLRRLVGQLDAERLRRRAGRLAPAAVATRGVAPAAGATPLASRLPASLATRRPAPPRASARRRGWTRS